jgi:hypothetical protein
MYISPLYRDSDWKALNLAIQSDWRKAVQMLKDRLNARFFDAVKAIDKQDFSGFAVLALDCLLIETLQQFKEGVGETPSRKSGKYFELFLTSAPFSTHFTKVSAAKFYDHFRCGILHQAEIKSSSKVWRVGSLVAPAPDGKGLIINRKLFHATLRKAFAAYLRALRNRSDALLCQNFVKKMNHICNR